MMTLRSLPSGAWLMCPACSMRRGMSGRPFKEPSTTPTRDTDTGGRQGRQARGAGKGEVEQATEIAARQEPREWMKQYTEVRAARQAIEASDRGRRTGQAAGGRGKRHKLLRGEKQERVWNRLMSYEARASGANDR
jgi:hypothetical protein